MPRRKANKTIDREFAIGALRGILRVRGYEYPERQPAKYAIVVLDDVYRGQPDLKVSRYYEHATDREIKLFMDAWNAWRRTEIRRLRDEAETSKGRTLDTSPAAR